MDRVSLTVQRHLALILQKECDSLRYGLLTISAVKISRDLQHARVYITCYNPPKEMAMILADLNNASGYYRSLLGKQIRMKFTPNLKFVYDESVAYADKVDGIVQSVSGTFDTPEGDSEDTEL